MKQDREQLLKEQERLVRLHPMIDQQLRNISGVDHVGVGAKERGGELTGDLCFRVYVREKKPVGDLKAEEVIPSHIMGIQTDVLVKKSLEPIAADRGRHRPLRGGIQIRNQRVDEGKARNAGTLGVLVTKVVSSSSKLMGLTCQHVLAHGVYNLANPNAPTGLAVGQPDYSTCCCCVCGDVGYVFSVQKDADVDCGLVELKEDLVADISSSSMVNRIEGIGDISGVAQAVCFERVRKRGAGTQVTEGIVVDVRYEGSQILIRPTGGSSVFADFGDSGSVLVNDSDKIVGLVWAANRNQINFQSSSSSQGIFTRPEAVANHIGPVMSALGISIAGQDAILVVQF
jgi:hypothetical protein